MKKTLLVAALALAAVSADAQQTYNYFDASDVDADGWLWLDTPEKLAKYCGVITNSKSYKIGLVDATYEDDMFMQPACELNAAVQGWNAAGVRGGEGSKTGGIVMPASLKTLVMGYTASENGGGILLQLPDCAELSVYVSTSVKDVLMASFGAAGKARAADCQIIQAWQDWLWADPVPDTSYCGYWNNLQDTKIDRYDENGNVTGSFQLKSESAVTGYVVNLEETEMILHGLKVMTYTPTAGVEAVSADNAAAPCYDLLGRRVDDTYRGLVISAGRKFIRR